MIVASKPGTDAATVAAQALRQSTPARHHRCILSFSLFLFLDSFTILRIETTF